MARTIRAGDLATIVICALAVQPWVATGGLLSGATLLVGGSAAVVLGLNFANAYAFSRHEGLAYHLARMALALGVAAAAMVAGLWATNASAALWKVCALWLCLLLIGLQVLHAIWFVALRHWRGEGRLTPNIVMVGATAGVERLIDAALESRDTAVLGVFDDRLARSPGAVRGVPVLGDTAALMNHRILPYVDRIVIGVPPKAQARVRQLIERLRVLPNEIVLLLDGDGAQQSAAFSRIADRPLAHVSGAPADERRAFAKRVQDVTIGLFALILALPVMAAVAIAIRLEGPGPILFRQRRHGFNNEEIVVWKFRSMRHEAADAHAERQVSAGDDRITRVGRFIRNTSLDELPQILNVLKGEMSLVGPRPHAVGMKTGDVESARLVAEYAHRHRMKPGITGWAAIHGSRGPVDTAQSVRRRVALDIEYIERQSAWLDLYILAMTLPCLLGDAKTVR